MKSKPNRSLTRRAAIKTALAGAAVAAIGPTALSAKDRNVPAGYVDCHSHIWTRDVKKYPLAEGKTVADLDPPSFTTEELLALARPLGVGRVVLIAHTQYYVYDNTYMVDAAKAHPGVFSVVGALDHELPRVAERMRKNLGDHIRSYRIASWRDPKGWLQGEGMTQMWTTAAEEGISMGLLLNPENLPQVDRMCEKFPDTPVVIDHFGRVGVDGEIRKKDLDNLCRLARHKHVHVKVSAYYALGKKQPPYLDLAPMIRRVLDAYGANRCMWGSDAPYQIVPPHTYQASLDLVTKQLDFLSDEDRSWLLGKTAEKVYFA
ncbi:MAG: amidohydrolase family protein [Pirellulaceae bacterium]